MATTGITGSGRFEAPHGPTATYSVDVSFDQSERSPG